VTNQTIYSLACTAGTGVLITPVGFESAEAILCSSRECCRHGSFKPRQFQSKEWYRHNSFKPRQFQSKEWYRHNSSKPPQYQSQKHVFLLPLWIYEKKDNNCIALFHFFIQLVLYAYSIWVLDSAKYQDFLRTFHERGIIGWALRSASPRPSLYSETGLERTGARTGTRIHWNF
jgi:hypothetical protein